MKIGILSMQNVINYGSFLQAYALKRTIESLGHNVTFINIRPGEQIVIKGRDSSKHQPKRYNKILKRVYHVLFEKKRKSDFKSKYFPIIGINKPSQESECDMIVIGSDEVFNCCQPSQWGFSTQLLGDTEVKSITYAASCGYTTYESVCHYGMSTNVTNALKKLSGISVRDDNTKQFVYELLSVIPEEHLDPVLIYDWQKEVKPQSRFKDYILIYSYDNRINNDAEINAIKAFAKKHRKKLISFGVFQRWCDQNVMCTPFELLAYFDGADYVITDTFHGTVISIKRGKQFATIIRDSNKNKLSDLLNRFGLNERELRDMKMLEDVITKRIDYDSIIKQIDAESARSVDYLQTYLK